MHVVPKMGPPGGPIFGTVFRPKERKIKKARERKGREKGEREKEERERRCEYVKM